MNRPYSFTIDITSLKRLSSIKWKTFSVNSIQNKKRQFLL